MKKYAAGITLLVIVAIALIVFLFVQNTSISPETGSMVATSTSETWEVYTNAADGYSISHPADLLPFPYEGAQPQMTFKLGADYPWAISLSVSTTTYSDPIQLLTNESGTPNQNINAIFTIEHVAVDGNDAILFYAKDNPDVSPDEKQVILIKNGKAYQIATRIGSDDEKVWESFHVLK